MSKSGGNTKESSPTLASQIWPEGKDLGTTKKGRTRHKYKQLPYIPSEPELAKTAESLYQEIQTASVFSKGEPPRD